MGRQGDRHIPVLTRPAREISAEQGNRAVHETFASREKTHEFILGYDQQIFQTDERNLNVQVRAQYHRITVRWLGELMLEAGRPRDAERYFQSISADPFAALRLARVYENLGEFEKARASYEYALLSWQNADPVLQPRIQEARRALARLPAPLRRERS